MRAYARAKEVNPQQGQMTEEDKKILFGQTGTVVR